MNPNNFNLGFINSDSIFHEVPGFEKAKTLSKTSMISRGDYKLLGYLGQQCSRSIHQCYIRHYFVSHL